MTDLPSSANPAVPRFVFILLLLAAPVIFYTQGTMAYKDTQEAFSIKASADNAAVKQHGEAVLLHEQATTELEKARNAVVRAKSEAEALEAEAAKIEAEAVTLKEKAAVADRKARADAFTIAAKARLRREEIVQAIAELRNVARKEKAEAEKIEADSVSQWSVWANIAHLHN